MRQSDGVKYLILRLPTPATKARKRAHRSTRPSGQVAAYLRDTVKRAFELRDQLITYDYRSRVYAVVESSDGTTVVSSNGMKWRV